MAQKFVTNLDLNQNQLLNATFEVLANDPGSNNFEGRLIYNSTEDTIKVYTGSAWRKMLHGIVAGGSYTDAISISEANGQVTLTLNLADTDSAGLLSSTFWNMLNDATSENTASKLVKRDANGNIKISDPTEAAHAATKQYVDAARSGLDVKASVRAATTATVNLSTDVDAGSVIDGVTLVAGDRILIKDQGVGGVAHVDNGIYVVAASGAPTRATDADSSAEVTAGLFTFVEEGTANGDAGFVLATNGAITVGSTALLFTQFSGTGQITAGDGLSKSGSTLNINDDDVTIYVDGNDDLAVKSSATAGQVLRSVGSGTAEWGALDLSDSDATTNVLPINRGGTSASTVAEARTALAETSSGGMTSATPVLGRVTYQVLTGSSTSYTVTHNFGTRNVVVQVFDTATYETVFTDVTRSTTDSVTIGFAVAPSSGAYTAVVTG
jgi:hypothetical protein